MLLWQFLLSSPTQLPLPYMYVYRTVIDAFSLTFNHTICFLMFSIGFRSGLLPGQGNRLIPSWFINCVICRRKRVNENCISSKFSSLQKKFPIWARSSGADSLGSIGILTPGDKFSIAGITPSLTVIEYTITLEELKRAHSVKLLCKENFLLSVDRTHLSTTLHLYAGPPAFPCA